MECAVVINEAAHYSIIWKFSLQRDFNKLKKFRRYIRTAITAVRVDQECPTRLPNLIIVKIKLSFGVIKIVGRDNILMHYCNMLVHTLQTDVIIVH